MHFGSNPMSVVGAPEAVPLSTMLPVAEAVK
jgi:hypothetical protein